METPKIIDLLHETMEEALQKEAGAESNSSHGSTDPGGGKSPTTGDLYADNSAEVQAGVQGPSVEVISEHKNGENPANNTVAKIEVGNGDVDDKPEQPNSSYQHDPGTSHPAKAGSEKSAGVYESDRAKSLLADIKAFNGTYTEKRAAAEAQGYADGQALAAEVAGSGYDDGLIKYASVRTGELVKQAQTDAHMAVSFLVGKVKHQLEKLAEVTGDPGLEALLGGAGDTPDAMAAPAAMPPEAAPEAAPEAGLEGISPELIEMLLAALQEQGVDLGGAGAAPAEGTEEGDDAVDKAQASAAIEEGSEKAAAAVLAQLDYDKLAEAITKRATAK